MGSGVQALPSRRDIASAWESPAAKAQFALLACLLAYLYGPILGRLVSQWSHDANFSHGFFVPAFSLYVLWDRREILARVILRPSWTGFWPLLAGLLCLIVGVLGAELYLSRVSLVPVLGGLVVLFLGWRLLKATTFPWLFLLLMIPPPALIFNQITFPLQIFASQAAANLLPLLGVPVLREGNVIHLPAMALEVAEACSGIRSLMSLVTLAVMYGYVLESRRSFRVLLALAAVPIAVAANSLRIVGTGLLVQYWDPDKAEGFFHTFSGWIIFVVSVALLFAVRRVLHWTLDRSLDRPVDGTLDQTTPQRLEPASPRDGGAKPSGGNPVMNLHSHPRFLLAMLPIALAAAFLHTRGQENPPAREPLSSFPRSIGARSGIDYTIPEDIREVLGNGDFLWRLYPDPSGAADVDLFVAYFASQRAGDTLHSPKNCLPGDGWFPIRSGEQEINAPGVAPFRANEYLVAKDSERRLVLYWYQAHNRAVANEYWAKFYQVADAVRYNRSDGSLIRITTPLAHNEPIENARQRLLQFVDQVTPQLGRYIPQ